MARQHFIDWMKALGMFLIVAGHVIGDGDQLFNAVTAPIYTKQLGVAFFVFIAGWGLAHDHTPGLKSVFNRLFALFFYGGLCAVVLSAILFVHSGDINESDFLPFFLGANVFLNHFPANPTTWYIGLYIHLVLFWFLFLRNKPVKLGHIVLAFVIENIARVTLIEFNRDFTAYMFLSNWITLFLVGRYCHQKADSRAGYALFATVAMWVFFLVVWYLVASFFAFDQQIPFRKPAESGLLVAVLLSLAISVVYLVNTLLCFNVVRRIGAPAWIRFFSRNTLIVFLIHIPLIFNGAPYFYQQFGYGIVQQWCLIVVVFIGCAWLSEAIQSIINLKALRSFLWAQLAIKSARQ